MPAAYLGTYNIRSAKGIPEDIRIAVRPLVAWLRRTQPLPDRLGVIFYLRPEPAVAGPDGEAGFGCFRWPKWSPPGGGFVWIYLAAGMVERVEVECGDSREEAIRRFLMVLLHEWVHFDQWRNGQELSEHAVNRRAGQMLAAYRRATSEE